MRTFIENCLHFIKKNCIRPPYKKLKSLKSGFIENSNFENNREPFTVGLMGLIGLVGLFGLVGLLGFVPKLSNIRYEVCESD